MGVGKDHALGLYMEGIRDGRPDEALAAHTGARYTQHSTGVPNGQEGFLTFFRPFLERNPDRDIRVLRAIEDGKRVFCHVYQSLNGGAARWVTMDMFDTDADGRIIEHWDVIAPYAKAIAGGGDMIEGPGAPGAGDAAANKALVTEYVKRVLTEGRDDELGDFVAEDVIDRSGAIASGRAALAAALADGRMGRCEMLFAVLGEGDLVAAYCKFRRDDADHAGFELYRVAEGRIAERWAVAEEIGPRESWGNSGKF